MTDIHDIHDGESRTFEPSESPPEQAHPEPRIKTPTIAANDCSRWVGKEPPPLVFTIHDLVPQGMVTLLIADGGAGKSMLMQTAMTCIPSGLPFLGKSTSGGATVGLFAEDPDAVLHLRQQRINKSLDVSMESLPSHHKRATTLSRPTGAASRRADATCARTRPAGYPERWRPYRGKGDRTVKRTLKASLVVLLLVLAGTAPAQCLPHAGFPRYCAFQFRRFPPA